MATRAEWSGDPVDDGLAPGRWGRLVARLRRPARGHTYDEPMASRPTAACFDLDKTIIAKSSTLAFSKPFQAGGLISRRGVLRSAYAQFVYLVGGADHEGKQIPGKLPQLVRGGGSRGL